MARRLSDFEPATAEIDPEATRDLLKKLYQYLVPKKLRHDLGEYYTPDWLAERLLNQVGYDGNPDLRLLDPACGSGTFLALAIKRVREYIIEHLEKYPEATEVAKKALKNIVGFDLNPIAVIAARTTYLLALGNLRRAISPITIPVYMCDSILTPTEYADLFRTGHKIHTTVGDFFVPKEVVDKGALDSLATLIEECVRDYSTDEFIGQVRRVMGIEENGTETALRDLFEKVKGLEEEGRNRIWARILKNAFAPIFQEPFDYVVGNPPWVNWESLSDEYREATKATWEKYGLQARAGAKQFALGKVKRDISMLFTYVCIDEYLKPKGKLGFLITQTAFKTESGEVFRKFRLDEELPLRILHVDDMVELKPFEGASNWTSAFVCVKGERTRYPVPYTLWRKKRGTRITIDNSLEEVIETTARIKFSAKPIDDDEPTSAWITARQGSLAALAKVIGPSVYEARAGAVTWADGIYWVRILDKRPDGLLVIQNLHDVGKRKLRQVKTAIEPDLVYPFVRWGDISRWYAKPSCYIVLPHSEATGWRAIPESQMKSEHSKTFAYFKQFETELKDRSGYKQLREGHPFYIMSNTGPWLFAPVKVLWKAMTRTMEAAVVEQTADEHIGLKTLMHKNTVTYVPFDTPGEAHFLCALLNTTLASLVCASYSVGKSLGSPHVLKRIAIPKYDPKNALHEELSALSQPAHELAAKGEKEALKQVEAEIDRKAAELWGVTKSELKEIGRSLEELS